MFSNTRPWSASRCPWRKLLSPTSTTQPRPRRARAHVKDLQPAQVFGRDGARGRRPSPFADPRLRPGDDCRSECSCLQPRRVREICGNNGAEWGPVPARNSYSAPDARRRASAGAYGPRRAGRPRRRSGEAGTSYLVKPLLSERGSLERRRAAAHGTSRGERSGSTANVRESAALSRARFCGTKTSGVSVPGTGEAHGLGRRTARGRARQRRHGGLCGTRLTGPSSEVSPDGEARLRS